MCKRSMLSQCRKFLQNLSKGYEAHKYPPSQNWNFDKSGAQVNQNGNALILAQTGS